MKILLIGLILNLGACATVGDARYWNAFAIQAAQNPDWNGANNQKTTEFKLVSPPQNNNCYPQYDIAGNFLGCL